MACRCDWTKIALKGSYTTSRTSLCVYYGVNENKCPTVFLEVLSGLTISSQIGRQLPKCPKPSAKRILEEIEERLESFLDEIPNYYLQRIA